MKNILKASLIPVLAAVLVTTIPSDIYNRTPSILPIIKSSGQIQAYKGSNLPHSSVREIMETSGIEPDIDEQGMTLALKAFNRLKEEHLLKKEILVIIDYRKPSFKERFFVLDMKHEKLLFKTLVAHGRNSGFIHSSKFSNRLGSYMSSLGVFLTGERYIGRHGPSLNLDGLEEGINTLARKRRIVIHGASYVSRQFIKQYGHLGRSLGCPALPEKVAADVIDTIKDGCCVVALGNDPSYLSISRILQKTSVLHGLNDNCSDS